MPVHLLQASCEQLLAVEAVAVEDVCDRVTGDRERVPQPADVDTLGGGGIEAAASVIFVQRVATVGEVEVD